MTASAFPVLSARLSYPLWTKTHRYKTPQREKSWQQTALIEYINTASGRVVTYRWGTPPYVLLLHGWNGRALQMSGFNQALLDAGFGVLAVDAPGHGVSDGKHGSVMQSVAAIKQLYEQIEEINGVLAHSFGFMTAVNAINEGLDIKAIVGISPPAQFHLLLDVFSQHVGINSKAKELLENYVKARYKIDSFSEISIDELAKKLKLPCLIVHSKDDDKVPLSQAQLIAQSWDGARLNIVDRLGHTRILRDANVITQSVRFLRENITKNSATI